jgi:hypothetical protein
MIPRNLKHVGPYAHRLNDRQPSADRNDAAPPDDCKGALRHTNGGFYLPWGPYVDPGELATMQRKLFAVVEELARLECWPPEYLDHVTYCVERQPISTLRPDLAYFTELLRVASAEDASRQRASRRVWKYDR